MPAVFSILLLLLFTSGSQPSYIPSTPQKFPDRVVIKPKRVVLVRHGYWARQFPERSRATIRYPVVSGLIDGATLKRVRAILRLEKIFESSLEDYRQDNWLTEFTYKVNYNKNYILDITFIQSGVGAYPDTQTRHFAINLKRGDIIKASQVFQADKLQTLVTMVDGRLQAEIRRKAQETRRSNKLEPSDAKSIVEGLEQLKFEMGNLDDFSVGSNGLTFLYDAGFPHVFAALEPDGRYFFSYSELKPFIRSDGPLGQFVD